MKLLTCTQFANLLDVSSDKIRRLSDSGLLNPFLTTDGGHRRYSEEQLEQTRKLLNEIERKPKIIESGTSFIDNYIIDEDYDKYYMLGLFMADGSINESGEIHLEMIDEQIVQDVADFFDCNIYKRKSRNLYCVVLNQAKSKWYKENGICCRKGKNGFISPKMNFECFRHYLRGLFDGDGSVHEKQRHLRINISGNINGLDGIQKVLLDNNIYMGWYQGKITNNVIGGIIETATKDYIKNFYNIIYPSNCRYFLQRKHEKFVEQNLYYGFF